MKKPIINKPKTPAAAILPVALLMTLSALAPAFVSAAPAQALSFPDPAMQNVWNRTDLAVQERTAARSWMWGPDVFYTGYEPYIEGVGGQHLVAYLDKSRMEINNPAGDRNNLFFVTNGLLVVEMMSGKIQTGNATFQPAAPANIPVAGDASSINAPTYASLAAFASLNGDNRAPNRVGQQIQEGVGRTGGVGILPNLAAYSRYAVYESTLGHNIPDVFWNFMNQKGPVYVNGRYVQDTVVDWVFAMGYPVTEPYWINIQVGSEQRWVLVQAFQRRILTYSPNNPAGFQVEMGNVGRAYFDWRYGQAPAQPTSLPVPSPTSGPAAISLNPTQGDGNTTITVAGTNFPANSPVDIRVERADANYYVGLVTVNTGGDGKFTANVRLPADAAKYGTVTIAALANRGSLRASANFTLNFNPSIDVTPKGFVINGGSLGVTGRGFPAISAVRVGVAFDGASGSEYLANTRTDGNGNFQVNINIGNRTPGARFIVFANGENNTKASYNDRVTVIAQPGLQVIPGSGTVGVTVNLRGFNWPAGQQVAIGYKGLGDSSEGFLPDLVTIDRSGEFNIAVYVDPRLGNKRQVIFSATETRSNIRAEAAYTIIGAPTPVPATATPVTTPGPNNLEYGLDMSVQTYQGFGNTYVKLSGRNWRADLRLTISVVSSRGDLNVGIGTATVKPDGTWQLSFDNIGPWVGRYDVGVRASDPTGTSVSGRRLPTTRLQKVSGATYTVSGSNWGVGTQVEGILQVDGSDVGGLGSTGVDPNGNFAFNVTLQRASGERQIVIKSRTGLQYSAVLGVDNNGGAGGELTAPISAKSGSDLEGAAATPKIGMPKTGNADDSAAGGLVALALLGLALSGLAAGILFRAYSQSRRSER